MKHFVLFVALTLAFALPAGAQRYHIASLPGSPSAVNNVGQVAGAGFTAHAFLWSKTGGTLDLGTLPGGTYSQAYVINDSGQVTGYANTATEGHAFFWSPSTGMIDILPAGSSGSPVAINSKGDVGGSFSVGGNPYRAFLWDSVQGLRDLGFGDNSSAYAMNDAGQVVGSSGGGGYFCGASGHAFLWLPASGTHSLDFPGALCTTALSINNNGQVAGYYRLNTTTPSQAFLWSKNGGFQTLPSLGGGNAAAFYINSSGQVAGVSQPNPLGGYFHAFLWDSTSGIHDIAPIGTGKETNPFALNRLGEIVGVVEYYPGSNSLLRFDWTVSTGLTPTTLTQITGLHPLNDAGQLIGLAGKSKGYVLLTPGMNVVLNATPNPSKVGQNVTFTAKVKAFVGPPPNGEMVQFKDGTATLATVPLANGVAKFTTSSLLVGTHSITANYVGDANYDPSVSKAWSQAVK